MGRRFFVGGLLPQLGPHVLLRVFGRSRLVCGSGLGPGRQEVGGGCVVCDMSDIVSVKQAAREIIGLNLPLAGLLNNAGIMATKPSDRSAQGSDMTFATNYLDAFALTEALMPNLPDGANVVFIGKVTTE